MRSGGFGEANTVLAIEDIDLDPRSCHQSWRIDYFEPVVGEADDLLLAQDLQRPTDMNVVTQLRHWPPRIAASQNDRRGHFACRKSLL
jgi:hypothetical protein